MTHKEVRRLWAEALRSENYEWGTECLKPDVKKFCCLGVLCDLAVKGGLLKEFFPTELALPREVIQWIGINGSEGQYSDTSLSSINDNARENPFKKIADIIEAEPEGLFVD